MKSRQGVQFRRWATSILKQYLIKGYAINQQIKLDRYNELKDVVRLMARAVGLQEKVTEHEYSGLFNVISDYVYALYTLDHYDYQSLSIQKTTKEKPLVQRRPQAHCRQHARGTYADDGREPHGGEGRDGEGCRESDKQGEPIKNKKKLMDNRPNIIIYRTVDGKASVALYATDGKIWLNQQQMAELFATSKPNISMHISNILKEKELNEQAVVKNFLTTANDGKNYNVVFYSLEMIIAVGYRVRGVRGTQFRQWATEHLTEYLVKGFTMDDERLKNPDGRPDYFDELLLRIRDIRASEKRFYQKVRDLFALSSDYDKTDKATQMFFAETQNKLLYAVTHKTAAEIVVERADASKPNMGLTSWKGTIVRKGDVVTAKNYLHAEEIEDLNRLVDMFLTSAEMRVKDRHDLTLDYWRKNVDALLMFQDKEVLQGKGSMSNAQMEAIANKRYDEFNAWRKQLEAKKADEDDMKMLEDLEKRIKPKP